MGLMAHGSWLMIPSLEGYCSWGAFIFVLVWMKPPQEDSLVLAVYPTVSRI